MEINQFVWGVVDSNSWLITEGEHGLLIDAVDSNELFNSISELKSLTIILTHSHFDHIVGLNRIREIKPDTTVISTKNCSDNIGNKYRNMSSTADAFMTFYYKGESKKYKICSFICESSNITFKDEFTFEWYGHHVELTAVHGHSDDSLIIEVDNKLLFTGDTLLPVPTITRFPRGNNERFWLEDVPILKKKDDVEMVYPGHGRMGSIYEMFKINKMPGRLNIK